jgi:hypothetical protein
MTKTTTRRAAFGAIAGTAIAGTVPVIAAAEVHASDCATNNAPALPVGDCDCGKDPFFTAMAEYREALAVWDKSFHIDDADPRTGWDWYIAECNEDAHAP